MSNDTQIWDELRESMTTALVQMQRLSGALENPNFVSLSTVFLLSLMSTAADLAEMMAPGAATYLYSEMEAGARQGGLHFIEDVQTRGRVRYSISGIAEDDMPAAMNYVGQALSTTLFKTIHELPKPLRTPEMLLRGVEALLANLLKQKFDNSHEVLDSLCEHVHLALEDLQSHVN